MANDDNNFFNDAIPLEKLLEKVDNKYKIVMMAAKRARQLNDGAMPLVKTEEKYSTLALREILEGKLEMVENLKKKKGEKSEPRLSGISFSGGSSEEEDEDKDSEDD
jgi:DNA-directed RNA polymerase subunit omega